MNMPDFEEVLRTRRSVRDYAEEPLAEEKVEALIELATYAPSGNNGQPWRFTVITDQALLGKVNDRAKAVMRESDAAFTKDEGLSARLNDPGYNTLHHAPALILIHGPGHAPTALIDCQLAAANLLLAAHARGLGTCYAGFVLFGRDDVELRSLLRIPEDHELMAALVAGHPAVVPPPRKREPARVQWVR